MIAPARADRSDGIRAADADDLAPVCELLAAAGLPTPDLGRAHMAHFLVAPEPSGALAGVIGLEPRERAGLLRSLAVAPTWRAQGLGRVLVTELEARAAASGIEVLYLLTETAERFFDALGYRRADRAAVPDAIAATTEFASLCPDSAVCMRKDLAA